MTSRRHRSPSAPPLDDDNLLYEILLHLPPQPSSLPHASAVCKRWRSLLHNPRFIRRFRLHHRRSPPLLGCFVNKSHGLTFVPTMEAPNRIPPERFSLQLDQGGIFQPLGCRHGLALIYDQTRQQFLVWDPITGDQHGIAFPVGFDLKTITGINGAVRRAAGDHFQVVFLAIGDDDTQPEQRALTCIYSSETGVWGDLVSTPVPSVFSEFYPKRLFTAPAVLVGDSLYWILARDFILEPPRILEFDLKRQSLVLIPLPYLGEEIWTVMRSEGGGLGLLSMFKCTAQLWNRKIDCDGVDSWDLGRTIELDKLLSLNIGDLSGLPFLLGFAESNNVVFVRTDIGVFMVNLESLKFKNISESNICMYPYYHPFECVYTAGIGDGDDAADLSQNT